jgi:hypothetical protein
MKLFCVLATCFVFVGCSTPPLAKVPPSPQPIRVFLPSSLEPVREALNICAVEHPEIALFTDSRSTIDELTGSDIAIWWGDQPSQVSEAFQLADDQLVIIVNQENPVDELTADQLINLFSGRIEEWSEISEYQQPVMVWTFPDENQLGIAFQSAVLEGADYSLLSYFAPTPAEMLEAIKEQPGAIGFIPRSWLDSEISAIEVDRETSMRLTRPLLALTSLNPRGAALILIDCLQSGEGQAMLSEKFSLPE